MPGVRIRAGACQKHRTDSTKMTCGKSLIPYGFKTLVETLGKTVLFEQPVDIHQFASIYFKELLAFRAVNPNLDLKELVNLFYINKVIPAGSEKRAEWLSNRGKQAHQNGTASSNMFVPIGQKSCFLIERDSLEDVPDLHEDLIPRLLMTETNFNKSNMVSKKEISEMVAEDQASFVYIYTNTCSVNQDESGFAYIYTNASSVNQEDKLTNIKQRPAHLEVATGQVTQKALPVNCKDTLERANELNNIPILAQVQRALVDNSTNRHAPAPKSQPISRKSESVAEVPTAHRALSSETVRYQKAISATHKAVPVHASAIPTHTEHTPALCSDLPSLDNYKQVLMSFGRVSYPIEAASADQELGVNEAGSEIQDTESISTPYQSEKASSQNSSDSETEGSAPVTYHSYSQVPESQLDLQMLHSETQKDSLSVVIEIFHKVSRFRQSRSLQKAQRVRRQSRRSSGSREAYKRPSGCIGGGDSREASRYSCSRLLIKKTQTQND
uniref:uncharacterized protein n=1 Tax=Pristiophorus japonicus TaxID=55135 RepID=UPI00398F6224